jgi:hypothetical protein
MQQEHLEYYIHERWRRLTDHQAYAHRKSQAMARAEHRVCVLIYVGLRKETSIDQS